MTSPPARRDPRVGPDSDPRFAALGADLAEFAVGVLLDTRVPFPGCRCAGKALALAVFNELVIGQALLVSVGAGLVQLRLSSLALRLRLGHSRPLFGRLGAFLADTRLMAMLPDDSVAALLQLALTSPDAHTG